MERTRININHIRDQVFKEESHTQLLNEQVVFGELMPPFRFDPIRIGKERKTWLNEVEDSQDRAANTCSDRRGICSWTVRRFKDAYQRYREDLSVCTKSSPYS